MSQKLSVKRIRSILKDKPFFLYLKLFLYAYPMGFIFSITKEPFYHYQALFSFQMTYQFTIFFTFVGLCSIKILLHLFSNKPKGHHHVVKLLPEVLHKPDPLQLFAVSAVHHVEEPGPV